MSENTHSKAAIERIRDLRRPEHDDMTTLHFDGMPEKLRVAAEKMMSDHKDLWFVEIRDKSGKEIMVFRGPHP